MSRSNLRMRVVEFIAILMCISFFPVPAANRSPKVLKKDAEDRCQERGIYQSGSGRWCCLCSAGEFKASDCDFGVPESTDCELCLYDKYNSSNQMYMETSNNSTHCHTSVSKSVCENLIKTYHIPGSRTKPSRCECVTGYEEDPLGTLMERGCMKKISCVAGYQLNPDRSSDVICVECPSGTFSTESNSSCMPFKRCESGTMIVQNGTMTSDVVCSTTVTESTTPEVGISTLSAHGTGHKNLPIILGVIVGGVALIAVLIAVCRLRHKRKKKRSALTQSGPAEKVDGNGSSPEYQHPPTEMITLNRNDPESRNSGGENSAETEPLVPKQNGESVTTQFARPLVVDLPKQNGESVTTQFARHDCSRMEEQIKIKEEPCIANGNLQTKRNHELHLPNANPQKSESANRTEPSNISETADLSPAEIHPGHTDESHTASTEGSGDKKTKMEPPHRLSVSSQAQSLKAEIMEKAKQRYPNIEVDVMEDRISSNLKDNGIAWTMLLNLLDFTTQSDLRSIVRELSLTDTQIADKEDERRGDVKEIKYQWLCAVKNTHGHKLTPLFLLGVNRVQGMPRDNMMKVFLDKLDDTDS